MGRGTRAKNHVQEATRNEGPGSQLGSDASARIRVLFGEKAKRRALASAVCVLATAEVILRCEGNTTCETSVETLFQILMIHLGGGED